VHEDMQRLPLGGDVEYILMLPFYSINYTFASISIHFAFISFHIFHKTAYARYIYHSLAQELSFLNFGIKIENLSEITGFD
jgi:hypothetical protein